MPKILTLADVYGKSPGQHNTEALMQWLAVMNIENTRAIFTVGLTEHGSVTVLAVPGADPRTVLETLKEIVKQWESKKPGEGNLIQF